MYRYYGYFPLGRDRLTLQYPEENNKTSKGML